MKVKVKKLNGSAVLPKKFYDEDFCYDVVATSEEEVAPNVWKYGIGLAFQIDRAAGMETTLKVRTPFGTDVSTKIDLSKSPVNLSIDFRPRSSVWKTGMVLSNCTGTIDELYRGEVSAVFYHVLPNMPRYKVGDRIGQIKLGMAFPMEFELVDELDESERGDGGYGSTGR